MYKRRSVANCFIMDDHRSRSTFGYPKKVCRAKIKHGHGWVSVIGWSGLLEPNSNRHYEKESVLHIIIAVSFTPALYCKNGDDYLEWFLEQFKNHKDYSCRLYELCEKMTRLESSSYSAVGKLNLFMTDTISARGHFNPETYINDLASLISKRVGLIKKIKFHSKK